MSTPTLSPNSSQDRIEKPLSNHERPEDEASAKEVDAAEKGLEPTPSKGVERTVTAQDVRHFSETLFPNPCPFWSCKTFPGSKLMGFAPQILPKHVSILQIRLDEAILTSKCASGQALMTQRIP